MMIFINVFIFVGFLANPVIIDSNSKIINKYDFLIQRDNLDLDINDVLDSKEFVTLNNENLNFGINDDIIWLRYLVKNVTREHEKYLFINNPSLDNIELYIVKGGNVIQTSKGGRLDDFSERVIRSKSIIFKIDLPHGENIEIYLKVKSINKTIITASINDIHTIERLINRENIIFGIFTGVIVGLFFL